MLDPQIRKYLLTSIFNAAVRAGAAIMTIYNRKEQYNVSLKSDSTPITDADREAHRVIRDYLGRTRIPILSEEGREMLYDERKNWEMFWLVDPLDGTVEFLKGNNEFTVNIALMVNRKAAASVVYVPCLGRMYMAINGLGAKLVEDVKPDSESERDFESIVQNAVSLPLQCSLSRPKRVALSRSHQTPQTAQLVEEYLKLNPQAEILEQGSSYKFCLLAEGAVDYYPRTTHTYEWDTAAGELILSEAGGRTIALPSGLSLEYNKEDLRNPFFEAFMR